MTKKQFYIQNLTWGLIMNIIGGIVALALIATKHKPKTFGGCLHFTVGEDWGGVSLGLIIITDSTPSNHTLKHECGHAVQNALFGVLFPFIVAIPSAIRYWYRELRYHRNRLTPATAYDDIWFEGQATELGYKYIGDAD